MGEDVVRNVLRGINRRLLRRLRRGAGRTVRQRRGDGCGRQGIRRIRRVAQRSSYEGIEEVIEALDKAKRRLDANVNFDLTMELLMLEIKENG